MSATTSKKPTDPEKKPSLSYWSKDKCICPVCKKPFPKEIMRSGNGRMNAGNLSEELHRDYIPSAKYGKVYPLIYEVGACPNCYAAFLWNDFADIKVMQAAFDLGADVLNDVSSFESDSNLASFAARTGISVILMHGYNKTEEHESDENITQSVEKYLLERAEYAVGQGIKKEKIILDPGIGFGKTIEENISLIKNADKLNNTGFPLLMALSRKRVIGYMTDRAVEERLTLNELEYEGNIEVRAKGNIGDIRVKYDEIKSLDIINKIPFKYSPDTLSVQLRVTHSDILIFYSEPGYITDKKVFTNKDGQRYESDDTYNMLKVSYDTLYDFLYNSKELVITYKETNTNGKLSSCYIVELKE